MNNQRRPENRHTTVPHKDIGILPPDGGGHNHQVTKLAPLILLIAAGVYAALGPKCDGGKANSSAANESTQQDKNSSTPQRYGLEFESPAGLHNP